MVTGKATPGRWTLDRGLTSPLLAYLVVVTLGVWVFQMVQEATQGRDLVGAGKALMLLALATAAVVVLGSMWMAGRWGGTARA
jgi:hypothetical protein